MSDKAGPLIFSCLCFSFAPSVVTRLLDLGAPPFLITSTLIGVIAQRLVRTLCPKCIEDVKPSEEDAFGLSAPYEKIRDLTFRQGQGCINCRQTGYLGRSGIYEIMPASRKLRKLIVSKTDAPEIVKTARDEGMRTLREAAIQKLVKGDTTVSEVIRVTGR